MKLPNILVFEGEGRRVAKISDFGSVHSLASIWKKEGIIVERQPTMPQSRPRTWILP